MPLSTIDSSGLSAAGVAQTNLAANVAGNGPLLLAYITGGTWSCPNNAETTIALNAYQYDTASKFNPTSSTVNGIPAYSYMPNVAGYYLVTAVVNTQAPIAVTEFLLRIKQNGNAVVWSTDLTPSTAHFNVVNASTLIYMNGTTDYLNCSFYQASGAALGLNYGREYTQFTATLIRSA